MDDSANPLRSRLASRVSPGEKGAIWSSFRRKWRRVRPLSEELSLFMTLKLFCFKAHPDSSAYREQFYFVLVRVCELSGISHKCLCLQKANEQGKWNALQIPIFRGGIISNKVPQNSPISPCQTANLITFIPRKRKSLYDVPKSASQLYSTPLLSEG